MSETVLEKSHIFVLSAPSGGGKNTVINRLLDKHNDLQYIISATTRPPRKGDVQGKDYYFLSESEFEARIEAGEFLEWARVYDYCYGTLKSEVNKVQSNGKSLVMDIDIQGALTIKKAIHDAKIIFLLPPSMKVLEERLRARGTDTQQSIEKRMKTAYEEIAYADQFDYQIINEDIGRTVKAVRAVVLATITSNEEEMQE